MFAISTRTEDRRFLRHGIAALAFAAIFLLAGCAEDDEATFPAQGPLEIIGNYSDNFGGTQQVTQTEWNDGFGIFHIISYFNASDFLVAQNDANNSFKPNKYSRFTWTTFLTSLYFCQSPFDAETFAAAFTATARDATDPENAGCGLPDNNFPWTRLTPQ